MSLVSGKIKTNHKKGIAAAAKAKKRAAAEERQAAYAKLGREEKLSRAGTKERQKLLAR